MKATKLFIVALMALPLGAQAQSQQAEMDRLEAAFQKIVNTKGIEVSKSHNVVMDEKDPKRHAEATVIYDIRVGRPNFHLLKELQDVFETPWSREVWNNAMDQLGLMKEEAPYYNRCALWTEMNKQYSDHAQTIADNILKKPLAEIPAEQIVPGIRAMALDLLKDKDHVYNIREYFHL